MYPAYPALAVNAAISLHIILGNINSTDPKDFVAKIPFQLRLGGLLLFCLASFVLSVLRIVGTITAYNAPLSVYKPLHNDSATIGGAKPDDFVCLGKEWYRFPSHYFLPEGVRAKFIKSEFSGLLPGEFSEAGSGFGLFPGAWLVPPGMNDENIEDVGKYTEVKHCTFIVDSQLPSTETTTLEPSYASDEGTWERAGCLPFLDGFSTTVLGRTLWVPDLPFVPERMKRVWGEYCLLKRKRKASPERERDHFSHLREVVIYPLAYVYSHVQPLNVLPFWEKLSGRLKRWGQLRNLFISTHSVQTSMASHSDF
ncbi:glycosyltransferase family 22 protein [Hortaea werneckii]|nr:glycosyltransferase family 22 protein [Hortaea werneckii]